MKPSRKRPRLPLHQIIFFSIGHVMNDLVNAILSSYLFTFQSKVLGLPNDIVGLIFLIPNVIDAFLAILLGYISDSFSIPYVSKFYGKRKSLHLIGCAMIAIFTPFTFMPCFFCDDHEQWSWLVVVYYVVLLTLCYSGWSLTQANFLTLIPVVAKRASEMVKLGAISSALAFFGGIYVYVVMWILLGSDVSKSLTFNQWKDFMNLSIIGIATGAFFTVIFHVGSREPSAQKGENKPPIRASFSTDSYEAKNPSSIIDLSTTHACSVSDVIQGNVATALVNPTFEEDGDEVSNQTDSKSRNCGGLSLDATKLEEILWQALSEKRQANDDTDSLKSSGYGDDITPVTPDSAGNVEFFMPITFLDATANIPNIIVSSRLNSCRVSPFVSPFASPYLSRSASTRSPLASVTLDDPEGFPRSRPGISRASPFPSPLLTPRSPATKLNMSPLAAGETFCITVEKHEEIMTDNTPDVETLSEGQYDLAIIDRSKCHSNDKKSSWKTLIKNPVFYKLGGAYMFTKMGQNITNSYLPLYLTDHLKFGNAAIAYFPLVILIAGVFASVAAKKLNKLLGNKWTFCLGSVMVMGSSGWFYLLTEETRHVTYVSAILSGCGVSIMGVTTLALAAEFVDTDRSSGAFLITSMSFTHKIFTGSLFYLLQYFSPKAVSSDCPECTEYVRCVFSFVPGISAFLGLVAFILFIPATIRCTPIVQKMDAETQTVDFPYGEDQPIEGVHEPGGHHGDQVVIHQIHTAKQNEEKNELQVQSTISDLGIFDTHL